MDRRSGSFPTGLVPSVESACSDMGYDVDITDHRPTISPRVSNFSLEGVRMEDDYAYQIDACHKMVEKKQGILKIATNGGKTEIACGVTKYLGLNTLFVVTTRELLYQARQRFQRRLGLDTSAVGIVGDGHFSPGTFITIATVDTLESRINTQEVQDLIQQTEVLFLDECHHVGSESWYTVSVLCPAHYRFGLSGTPLDRTDGANLRLIAACGPVIYEVTNKELVERGISAKAEIIFDQITRPTLKKGIRYPTAYKQGVSENPELLNRVIEWTKIFKDQSISTLILVEEISQGKLLDDMLWTQTDGEFIPHQFIYGEENTTIRQKALQDFASGSLPVLIASTILDEGVDVPTIDALILAGSRKSRIRTMQRLGRGLRGKKLIVVEFANYCHKYLIKHSMKRLDDYKAEDCFGIHQSGPDSDLVKKLWDLNGEKKKETST
jgi:superfamily II DNA or RNA helicase